MGRLVAGRGCGLRHGVVSLALAARVDLKVVEEMLGESSFITTADIYTSLLSEAAFTAGGTQKSHSGARHGRQRIA